MKGTYFAGVSALVMALSATSAMAADQPSDPASIPQAAQATEGEDEGFAGDIIVTATKREQTLQEVPISLAAISGKALDDQGIRQFTDLQSGVPNLQIDQTNGNYAITIRGLGSGASNLAFEQSVGLFVDGVYSGRARSLQTSFLDVERVEVVRGPQGALFGKNTNAGAISIISRSPTRSFKAEVRGGYEVENGGWSTSGFVSGPLSSTLSARLTASAGKIGAYINNRLTGQDEYSNKYSAARGQLLWEPSSNFDARIKVELSKNNIDGGNIVFNNLGACGVCNLARAAGGGAGVAQKRPAFFRTTLTSRPEYNDTQTSLGVVTLNWDVGALKLTSITSYQDVNSDQAIDTDVSALLLLDVNQRERSDQFFQEFRAAGSFGNLDAIAGITYIETDLFIRQLVYFNGTPYGLPFVQADANRSFSQSGNSISPYLALDYNVTQSLLFSTSLRYSKEKKSANITHSFVGVLPPTNLPYNLSGKRSEGLWDYSAKIRYKITPKTQVYLSYATGTKGGGFISNDGQLQFNILNNGATVDYQPERARSWELGTKMRFLDNRADLNIALFSTNFKNLQVSSYTGTSFTTGNAAEARSRGVEVEANFRPTENFAIGGTLAYLDAKYIDYPGAACQFNKPVTCTPATNNAAGDRLTRAPKWKGSAYVQAGTNLSDDLRLTGRVSADYTATSSFQGDLNPLNSQPGYTKFDARLGLVSERGNWEAAIIGKNLSNEVTFSQAFNVPLIAGNTHGVLINPPRTIMLELVKRF